MLVGYVGQSLRQGHRGTSGDEEGEEMWVGPEEGSNGPERSLRLFDRIGRIWGVDSSTRDGVEVEVITPTNCCEGEGALVGGRAREEGPALLGPDVG